MKKPKRVGGLQRKSAPVHNIKSASRTMRGVGPDHGGPGFARSLPTHGVVRPGKSNWNFRRAKVSRIFGKWRFYSGTRSNPTAYERRSRQ